MDCGPVNKKHRQCIDHACVASSTVAAALDASRNQRISHHPAHRAPMADETTNNHHDRFQCSMMLLVCSTIRASYVGAASRTLETFHARPARAPRWQVLIDNTCRAKSALSGHSCFAHPIIIAVHCAHPIVQPCTVPATCARIENLAGTLPQNMISGIPIPRTD